MCNSWVRITVLESRHIGSLFCPPKSSTFPSTPFPRVRPVPPDLGTSLSGPVHPPSPSPSPVRFRSRWSAKGGRLCRGEENQVEVTSDILGDSGAQYGAPLERYRQAKPTGEGAHQLTEMGGLVVGVPLPSLRTGGEGGRWGPREGTGGALPRSDDLGFIVVVYFFTDQTPRRERDDHE